MIYTLKVTALLGAVALVTAGCFHTPEPSNAPAAEPNSAAQTQEQGQERNNQPAAQSTRSVSATLGELLTLDAQQTMRCTYDYTNDDGKSVSGVTYVDPQGKRLRSDFQSDVAGKGEVNAHMLIRDKTFYMWSDADPAGISLSYEGDFADVQTPATEGDYTSEIVQRETAYQCEAASAGESEWALPTDIQFIDFKAFATSTMQQMVPAHNEQ